MRLDIVQLEAEKETTPNMHVWTTANNSNEYEINTEQTSY